MELELELESSQELLDAHAHVFNQASNFINSLSLKCAVQLRISDIIHNHGKPITLSELVESLSIDKAKSQCIFCSMRVFVHSKSFIKLNISDDEEKSCYWLTPASCLLLKDSPFTLAPFVLLVVDSILTKAWDCMSEWLVNGRNNLTPFETTYRTSFWERVGHEPRLSSMFNEAMASDLRLVARVLVRECKHMFEGIESLVDVGGGTGTTTKAIVDAFLGMKCIVLDLLHVVDGLEETDSLTYVGGDIFEAIPPADAVLLKLLLHNWNDKNCLKILKNCKDAIPKKDKGGGKVMIIDVVSDISERDDKTMEDHLRFDMSMMAYFNGKERSEREGAKLFFEAGFTGYKITPAFVLRSLIKVYA